MKALKIVIIGPTGTGKTTLAKRLSEKLGWSWTDLERPIYKNLRPDKDDPWTVQWKFLKGMADLYETLYWASTNMIIASHPINCIFYIPYTITATGEIDFDWLREFNRLVARLPRPDLMIVLEVDEETADVIKTRIRIRNRPQAEWECEIIDMTIEIYDDLYKLLGGHGYRYVTIPASLDLDFKVKLLTYLIREEFGQA